MSNWKTENLNNNEVVPQIISEIVEMEHDVVAIAAVMVMKDGSLKTRKAFMEGCKFPLLAGTDILHSDMREIAKHINDQ